MKGIASVIVREYEINDIDGGNLSKFKNLYERIVVIPKAISV